MVLQRAQHCGGAGDDLDAATACSGGVVGGFGGIG
jgi:hypothetical protein